MVIIFNYEKFFMTKIEEELRKLPDLSQTVFKLQKMQNNADVEISQVLEVLQENSFVVAKIMKMANSKLFGFSNKIDTLNNAVSLYGINFTISSAISESINNILNPNLSLYPITAERFFYLGDESTKLMLLWLKKNDLLLIEELIIPCFISKIGTLLISKLVNPKVKADFSFDIKQNPIRIFDLEKKYTGFSSFEITVMILENWKFNEKIIDIIKNIDNPKSKQSAVLAVLNIIFNPILPFSKDSLLEGLKLARKYNLDENRLKDAIEEFATLTKNN
jgi:HD-like signal output (HDOD) protein